MTIRAVTFDVYSALYDTPAGLARAYDLPHAESYVDECHMCYELRGKLRERFPEHLAPAQMYGVADGQGA